jgi:hypothetical protein
MHDEHERVISGSGDKTCKGKVFLMAKYRKTLKIFFGINYFCNMVYERILRASKSFGKHKKNSELLIHFLHSLATGQEKMLENF